MKNPFDELGLSPLSSIDEITAELRERAEDVGEEDRVALRAAWEELTLHPRSRLKLALTTFPAATSREPRAPLPRTKTEPLVPITPTLLDLLPRPSVEGALAHGHSQAPSALPPISDDSLAFGEPAPTLHTRKRDNA